jgi:hypothetical protein
MTGKKRDDGVLAGRSRAVSGLHWIEFFTGGHHATDATKHYSVRAVLLLLGMRERGGG